MRPLPSCAQELPSTDHLCQSPQLAALAVLQAAVRVASQVLDIQHPELGSLDTLAPHADTDSILAQLIIDRGRELSELITCYRITLHPPASVFRLVDPDDDPF